MEQTEQTKLSAVSFFHSWPHRPFSLSIVLKLVWAASSQSQFGWCSQSCFDHIDRQMGDEKLSVVFIYHLHPLWSWSCPQDVSLCLRRWNRLNVQTMSANRVNPVEMLSRLFAPFTSTWKGSGMRPSEMVWRQQRWGLSINIGDHDWRIQRTLCFHWVSCCESWAESSSCLVHTLLDWFPFHLILCLKGFLFDVHSLSVSMSVNMSGLVGLRLWSINQAQATEDSGDESCQQGRGRKEAWNSSMWDPWLVRGVRTCCGNWFRTEPVWIASNARRAFQSLSHRTKWSDHPSAKSINAATCYPEKIMCLLVLSGHNYHIVSWLLLWCFQGKLQERSFF